MANNPIIPQPPVQNYNPVHVLWTDIQCEYLITSRMERNEEFWDLGWGGKARFWRGIAGEINEIFGTEFTGEQVKKKWENLTNDYEVNIVNIDLKYHVNLKYFYFT